MNEELKIIISAVTEEAKRQLKEVRDELNKVEKEAEEAGKEVDKSMKGIGKGIAIAVAAVAALTAAMVKLGKEALSVSKGITQLNTAFQSAGSSAEDAAETYKELFGIFGDHDRAIETAQSLSRITTEADKLAEYYDILAGAAAKYGDGLQGEALAEQISETIASGKAVGDLERVLIEAGTSIDAFNNSLAQAASTEERELIVRNALNNALGTTGAMYRQANAQTIAYNKSQADLNLAMAQTTAYTTPLLTAVSNLGSTFLTSLAPAIKTVSLYLTAFIQLIGDAISWIGGLFGSVGGGSEQVAGDVEGYQKAMASYTSSLNNYFGATESGANSAIDSIQKLKKQTMGFDELNVVADPDANKASSGGGAPGGGGVGSMPTAPNPADFGLGGGLDTSSIEKDLENVRGKLESFLTLVGLTGAGFAAWKITSALKDAGKLGISLKSIASTAMIISGALLLIDGYSKAWTDGIDWVSFAEILAGVGLIVGGIALSIGGIATPIALVVGSIAMLIVGIKDLVENGYSMEAVILVAVAAIGIFIGVIWAMNSALLASPLTWIVVAIMAVVAAFVVLWNECEGFRQFWISVWDAIVVAFEATVAWFEQAGKDIAAFFVGAWEGIKTAWNACGQFFTECWNSITGAFSAVGKWFGDTFTGAWNGVKKAFSAVGSFFTGIWNDIKEIFTGIGDSIGSAVSNAFSSAVNWVLKTAIGIINGFISAINAAISVINLIPGVEISKIKKLEVPKLAKGGIVDSATLAIVGEQGKEAVMPLENNTEWIDILATRLAEKQGGASKIELVVDGKALGYATINSINNITRQTGALQLAIV